GQAPEAPDLETEEIDVPEETAAPTSEWDDVAWGTGSQNGMIGDDVLIGASDPAAEATTEPTPTAETEAVADQEAAAPAPALEADAAAQAEAPPPGGPRPPRDNAWPRTRPA